MSEIVNELVNIYNSRLPLLSFPTFLIGNPASLFFLRPQGERPWIPAFAGMTTRKLEQFAGDPSASLRAGSSEDRLHQFLDAAVHIHVVRDGLDHRHLTRALRGHALPHKGACVDEQSRADAFLQPVVA